MTGNLKIGYSDFAMSGLLPELVKRFQRLPRHSPWDHKLSFGPTSQKAVGSKLRYRLSNGTPKGGRIKAYSNTRERADRVSFRPPPPCKRRKSPLSKVKVWAVYHRNSEVLEPLQCTTKPTMCKCWVFAPHKAGSLQRWWYYGACFSQYGADNLSFLY